MYNFAVVCVESFPGESEIPDHNLDPPRFCRHALNCMLQDWQAVEAMIMNGYENKR